MSILHIAFYPSDWLAGTRGMSDAETGVYITLIAKMYEMAGPIERDDERLYRLCGSKSKASFLKSLNYLLSEGKIIQVKNDLLQERVQKEIKITMKKSDKARAAANIKWGNKHNKNNGPSHANAPVGHMPQRCQLELEVYKEELGKPNSCPFSDFWTIWPSKISKQSAQKAWRKLTPEDRGLAIKFAGAWFARWRMQNQQASAIHASTYLTQKRWMDEYPNQVEKKNGRKLTNDQSARLATDAFVDQNSHATAIAISRRRGRT